MFTNIIKECKDGYKEGKAERKNSFVTNWMFNKVVPAVDDGWEPKD